MRHLIGSHVILLNNVSFSSAVILAFGFQAQILLIDQVLRSFSQGSLLLAVHLEAGLVGHALLSDGSQHLIPLTVLVAPLDLELLLLLTHGVTEIVAVLAGLLELLLLLLLLFSLVDFCLAFDDGTPLVWVALTITRVVPVALLGLRLDGTGLVTERLLNALSMHLKRVYHLTHLLIIYLLLIHFYQN